MLGHTDIRTTQIYAKILDTKVAADMAELKFGQFKGQWQIGLKHQFQIPSKPEGIFCFREIPIIPLLGILL